jgi:hypothetical protein
MTTPNTLDSQVAELGAKHPDWEIWVVRRYIGGPVWCARPRGCEGSRRVLNADTPEYLSEAIAEAEAEDPALTGAAEHDPDTEGGEPCPGGTPGYDRSAAGARPR